MEFLDAFGDERLYFAGISIIAAAALLLAVLLAVYIVSRKNLEKKFDAEYGEPVKKVRRK